MRQSPVLLAVALALLAGRSLASPSKIADVTIKGTRVRLGDLVSGLAADIASTDLGPTPRSIGTRIITRGEVVIALHERGVDSTPSLPEAFRVRRQLRVLQASDIDLMVTLGLHEKLPHGTALQLVKSPRTVRVPDGWTDVRCELPRPPHRAGPLSSAVNLSFFDGTEALWALSVPVDLLLSQEATVYDVPRGSHVTFVIRRGLVEVRATGTVTIDADIGSIAPVTVMPSGRSFPARLEDDTTAVMVETP